MRGSVAKVIGKMASGQPDSVRKELKRKWIRTPWPVRHALRTEMQIALEKKA